MSNPINPIINILEGKRIMFLENDDTLDDWCSSLAYMLNYWNIPFESIINLESYSYEEVLRLCENVDVIIFHSTWTNPHSVGLKREFLKLTHPEQKKIFIELFIHEPHLKWLPDNVIHDIYVLNVDLDDGNWDLFKLENDKLFWELKPL